MSRWCGWLLGIAFSQIIDESSSPVSAGVDTLGLLMAFSLHVPLALEASGTSFRVFW